MNILVLNGSPKLKQSNTLKLTKAFLEGINENGKSNTEIIDIYKSHIEYCKGCYSCWNKTPGKCIMNDDMEKLIEKLTKADILIWSFPLYFYGMPSKVKTFLDRTLPLKMPFMSKRADGGEKHDSRCDLSNQKVILISSCGFCTIKNNYESLLKQFKIIYGTRFQKIICPEGELLNNPCVKARVDEYLGYVKKAGIEFGKEGTFSPKIKEKISELLYSEENFNEIADASWGVNTDNTIQSKEENGYNFMRQMASVYNKNSYKSDVVIEMYFTELKKTYQLCLGKEKCILKVDNFEKYDTRIETSFDLWMKISNGTVDGSEAMIQNKYKVFGDLKNMMRFNEFFGVSSTNSKKENRLLKTDMSLLLIQWIILWVVVPIKPQVGGILSIVAASTLSLFSSKYKIIFYEKISAIFISIFGVLSMININNTIIISTSYLIFGVMWISSVFRKIPLTAYYSCNNYNGESALNNPLFIKTNKIITMVWGISYLLTALFSVFLMSTFVASYTGLINTILPVFIGIFTVWFSKWYPNKVINK
ncbi:NAD(P)H dehydrogenase [Clostridium botulinum]|nr:NAD(P)H dehydrogenase [Clostridium botulinum]